MDEFLNKDDVVSMDAQMSFAKTDTSQFFQLQQALQQLLQPMGHTWLYQGVPCKVLKATGGGWHTGTIRLRLEFTPDEPPSSLKTDDEVL